MNKNWQGIMKVLEIKHLSKTGEVLWEDKNLLNILHTQGEEYILDVIFGGGTIPDTYYLGLDNRDTIAASDTPNDLTTEPLGDGYVRQPVLSVGEFTFSLTSGGFVQAQTPIVTFVAASGSWGPVNNLWLTTEADNSGLLISTVLLSSEVTLLDGEKVTMRLGLGMRDCTTP